MLAYFTQRLSSYIRINIVTCFFVFLIFLVGVVVGALAVKSLSENQKIELINFMKIFFTGLTQSPDGLADISAMLGTALSNNIKTVVIIWLLGFTIIGIPFVLFIVFTRGFIIGFTVGFLVNEYVINGLLFSLVSILPHNFFAIPAVLITAVAAISFSLILLRRHKSGRTNLVYESIGYSLLCLCMLILMLVAALIEIYISPIFMRLIAGLIMK